jgi:hypothetical protein
MLRSENELFAFAQFFFRPDLTYVRWLSFRVNAGFERARCSQETVGLNADGENGEAPM